MWKFKTKSAYTLVEAICSIAIFSILFVSALTTEFNAIRLRKYNNEEYKDSLLLETVKNNLMGNTSYDDLKKVYNSGKFYISNEFLSNEQLKAFKISDFTCEEVNFNERYIKLKVTDGRVIKVEIELHDLISNNEEISKTTVYKGNYQ